MVPALSGIGLLPGFGLMWAFGCLLFATVAGHRWRDAAIEGVLLAVAFELVALWLYFAPGPI